MNITKDLISPEELSSILKMNNKAFKTAIIYFMKAIKLDKINLLYKNNAENFNRNFADLLLEKLDVSYSVNEEEIKNIPVNGSVIIVSNHPYGGLDGIILLSILKKIRTDFKIVANHILNKIPEFSDNFIPVNPFLEKSGSEVNTKGTKNIIYQLKSSGAVGIFPAGEVSSFKPKNFKIEDKAWSKSAAKIIYKSNVPVVPIYFSGNNSLLFNILGLIHPALRTLRLPSELLNKKGSNVSVRIGKPIAPEKISKFDDANQMMRYLRAKTYSLESGLEISDFFKNKPENKEKIIEAVELSTINSELKLIRSNDLLFSVSNYEVFISEPESIPYILKEIGRLRELTFRDSGEGTNKNIDLDEYDLYYRHLFVWDNQAQKIAGAYRIGVGKEIYQKYKRKGFYLNKLFKIKKDFKEILKFSFELGRSFVTKEYQKKNIILFLLWKGVLAFLKREEFRTVKYLIGPVSISNDYSTYSKELLIKFIKKNHFDESLAKFIKPRKKFNAENHEEETNILIQTDGKDFKLIDKLISEIEVSNNKAPVLLKKYLSQNAKIIGFNIDPEFNNSLDGFLIMNLENLPEETLPMLEK